MNWNADQTAMLRRLRGEKKSFTQCATEMGLTPGQIAGKCNRLRGYKTRRKPVPAHLRKRRGEDVCAPNETEVLAAAMVADGESPASVAIELGVTPKLVRAAVERSKARERMELTRQGETRTAWGRNGSERDA